MGNILSKFKLSVVLAACLFGFGIAASTPVLASTASQAVCNGVATAGGGTCASDSRAANDDISSLLASLINIFSWVVGFLAVLMIIYGGYLFTINAGDAQRTTRARNTIIYALVGLLVVSVAQVLVHFVLNNIHT